MSAAALPEPDGVRIGEQLKAARLARRKTLAEVAQAADLTKGFLSKLERDQASASVASLIRICDTLGLSVGELFSATPGDVVRRSEYPKINFGGSGMSEYLLTPHGELRMQAILSEIGPGGGSGDEPYSLPGDVEFAFVVSGRLFVTLQDEELVLEPGDALTFAPHVPHSFRSAAEDGTTQVLWVISPALTTTSNPRRPS
jgi:transcriptional regulator with XRE-family HTH domain